MLFVYSSPIPPEIEAAVLYGYVVFTTFVVENGRVKGLSLHIDRLQQSSKEIFGKNISALEIIQALYQFLSHRDEKNLLVRMNICPKSFSLLFPEKIEELCVFISCRAVQTFDITSDISLQLIPSIRPFANHKTSCLLPYLLARSQAHSNGYTDALLYYNDYITEGPTWNIFFQHEDRLIFPNTAHHCLLNGITQQLIQNRFQDTYQILHANISVSDIQQYSSAYMCSAGIGVRPISQIENTYFTVHDSSFSSWYTSEYSGENIEEYLG